MNELLEIMDSEKDILEQLIAIDNKKMKDNITYEDFFDNCSNILKQDWGSIQDDNLLFITEGEPYTTLAILKIIEGIDSNVTIFVNQGYQGLNKWLVAKYKELTNNQLCEVDFGKNYNKYIKKGYAVIPLGEQSLELAVLEDFYG